MSSSEDLQTLHSQRKCRSAKLLSLSPGRVWEISQQRYFEEHCPPLCGSSTATPKRKGIRKKGNRVNPYGLRTLEDDDLLVHLPSYCAVR